MKIRNILKIKNKKKKKPKYCEICKKKISFINLQQKRKDDRIVCKKCLEKLKKSI